MRLKKSRKRIVAMVLAAILAVLVVAFILVLRGRRIRGRKGEAVRTQKVLRSVFTKSIDVSGYLEAADVQKVQFRGTGAITSVLVKVGDKVEKGQLLATIDDTAQRRNLLKAQQEIEKQRSTASRREMELLELDLQIAENNMEYTKAIANFDGEVTEVNVSVGDYSEAATTLNLMQVVDKSYLKAYVEVDETDVKSLHEGMEVFLNFDSLPNEPVRAVIHYIPFLGSYDSSSGIGMKKVELRIDNPPEGIFPGYSFSATIEAQSSTQYLLVQSAAVRSRRGRSYMTKVSEGGTQTEIEVSVRYLGEGISQLLSGDIKVGDEYVVNPSATAGWGGLGEVGDFSAIGPEGPGGMPR